MTKSRIRRKSRTRRWIENLLLLGGVVGVGAWAASNAIPAIWQSWENWVFDREVRGERATLTEYLTEKGDQIAGELRAWWGLPAASARSVPSSSRPTVIRKNALVGRLSIPRLRVSAIVREGTTEDTLGLAVGHIPSTAWPGQPGNVGVAGHRDTLFRGLRGIRESDLIQFETLGGNYVYQVESTEVVKPREVSVLRAGQYPELTLVTCYPFYYVGSAPDRFIVKARQVSQGPLEPQEAHELAAKPKPVARKVNFTVTKNHSRELAPGISLGVTETDVRDRRADGWMWLMPDRRTIWLRNQGAKEPVVFYGYQDGKKRELRITNIARNAVSGYLLLPEE